MVKTTGEIRLNFIYDIETNTLAPEINMETGNIPFDVLFRMQCVFSAYVLDLFRKENYGDGANTKDIANKLRENFKKEREDN